MLCPKRHESNSLPKREICKTQHKMRAVAVWYFCHFLYSPSVRCRVSEVLVFKLVHLRFHLEFLFLPAQSCLFRLDGLRRCHRDFWKTRTTRFCSGEQRAEKWERKRNENQFESWMLNDTRHDPTAAKPRRKSHLFVFCLFNRKCKFKIHTDFSSSSLCYVVVQPPLLFLIHPISCWFARLVYQMEEKAFLIR